MDIVKLALLLLDHFDKQIELADTKAQLTLAVDTLIAAFATTTIKEIAAYPFTSQLTPEMRLTILLNLSLLASLFISIYFALLAVLPTLIPENQKQNLFYFGHISQKDGQEFITAFVSQSEIEIREAVLAEVHAKATIANRKFLKMRSSLYFLIIALILWVIQQMALVLRIAQ